jgi:hypothetical protein
MAKGPAIDPYPERDESNPHNPNFFIRHILILSFHLHLDIPSSLFPWGFQIKMLACLIAFMRAICPAHLIFLDLITIMDLIIDE